MPTIPMFCGVIIRMYCAPGEHNPPHVHAYYQDDMATIDIRTGEIADCSPYLNMGKFKELRNISLFNYYVRGDALPIGRTPNFTLGCMD